MRSFHRLVALFLIGVPLIAGCGGAVGDACKENDECNDGLVCCPLTGSRNAGNRGTCQTDAVCDSMMSPPMDAGMQDAGPQDAGADDAGMDAGDAGPEAGPGPDAGADGAGADAGSDAAADAAASGT